MGVCEAIVGGLRSTHFHAIIVAMQPITLAPPPLWEDWIIDNPWPLMVCLLTAGVVLLLVARQRLSRGLAIAAVVGLVLGGGVYLGSRVITTQRRQVMAATQTLVGATAPMDVPKVQGWLAPGVKVLWINGQPWVAADDLKEKLEDLAHQQMIIKQQVVKLEGESTARDQGRSLVHLLTTANFMGMAITTPSAWLINWSKGGDGQWRATVIQCLALGTGDAPTAGGPPTLP
jgi:hypothetical protein